MMYVSISEKFNDLGLNIQIYNAAKHTLLLISSQFDIILSRKGKKYIYIGL